MERLFWSVLALAFMGVWLAAFLGYDVGQHDRLVFMASALACGAYARTCE